MPDLTLSDERKQYQQLAADFAANELKPLAAQCDHSLELPMPAINKAWEMGLLNVCLPESLGGLGLGIADACVIAEELAAGCAAISSAIWGNELAVAPLLVAGDHEQQQRLLAPLAQKFALCAYGFKSSTGPAVTYEVRGEKALLNGSLVAVNAWHGQWVLVQAQDRAQSSVQTVFVVSRDLIGGGSTRLSPLGLKAADLHCLEFNDTPVALGDAVGGIGGGAELMQATSAGSDLLVASCAVGIMRCALEHSVAYSKQRHTMGVPIAHHQAVGFMLADMARRTEAARFMVRKAAWLVDNATPDANLSALAREYALSAAVQAGIDAVQIFGGYGYSKEYPVEKLMRDAKMLQLLENRQSQTFAQAGVQLAEAAV